MNTKLTLKLKDEVIIEAKKYANAHKTSLSKIIESFLQQLTSTKRKESTITPLVKSLTGIIDLPKDFDYKKEYANHLANKYNK